jgi:hypothetical protein
MKVDNPVVYCLSLSGMALVVFSSTIQEMRLAIAHKSHNTKQPEL